MFHTRTLLVILGDRSTTSMVDSTIAGFHACTVVNSLTPTVVHNVFDCNKNAVFFSQSMNPSWAFLNPVYIRLTRGDTVVDPDSPLLSVHHVIEDMPKICAQWEIDLGDHRTQDSTGMCTQSPSECLLCKIQKGDTEHQEHILYESKHFYVVPGTGAFFEGYVMIVPKKHIMSVALMEPNELEDFFQVLDDMRYLLHSIYGKPVFAFECASGRTGEGKHKTSIVHAHVHLAPTEMPVLEEVRKSGVRPWLMSPDDFSSYGETPYMLYITQDNEWYITDNPHAYFPRQHPRQVLANWMGDYAHYNWRIYPYRERMDVIADEFRSYCIEAFDSLPKRIQSCVRLTDE